MATPDSSSVDSLIPESSIENPGYGSNDHPQDFTCICHEEVRLDDESISSLAMGDHITRPIKCCCCYSHLCFHHAILQADLSRTDLNPDVSFQFISFSESDEAKAKIVPVRESLNYMEIDIYKIVYKHPKYRGGQVTKNAENLMEKDIQYHAFLNNCEHMCRGCVTGEEKSIQVDTLDKCLTQSVFGCLPRLLRIILAILANVFDDFDFSSKYKECVIGIQSFALIVYLYLLVRQLVNLQFLYKLKKMCKKCRRSTSRNFLFGLVFIVISVVSMVVDAILQYNKCIAYTLTALALSFWFIIELCNVCSERCRRTTTRCICLCSVFTCCCSNKCFKAICGKCCKWHGCSKCCQVIMDCVDSCCHRILTICWSILKCCYKCLKRCYKCLNRRCVCNVLMLLWNLFCSQSSSTSSLSHGEHDIFENL